MGEGAIIVKRYRQMKKNKTISPGNPKIGDVYLIQIDCGTITPDGPQYICSKHGTIAAPIAIIDSQGHKRIFCLECISDFFNEHLGQVCRWEDELTKHDFEDED